MEEVNHQGANKEREGGTLLTPDLTGVSLGVEGAVTMRARSAIFRTRCNRDRKGVWRGGADSCYESVQLVYRIPISFKVGNPRIKLSRMCVFIVRIH